METSSRREAGMGLTENIPLECAQLSPGPARSVNKTVHVSPVRIAFVISTLRAGGAERVVSIMANDWALRGREVVIITLSRQEDDWYDLHPKIKRVALDLLGSSSHAGGKLTNNFRRIVRLRRELSQQRPDVVVSFVDTTNVLTLIATWGLRIPVVVSERIDPRRHAISLVWNGMRSFLYRYADAVVVQSSAVRNWAAGFVREKVIHIIPNPVQLTDNGWDRCAHPPLSGPTIVAMGRLAQQKGFDLLLKAFQRCAVTHRQWSLVIIGHGDERRRLEMLAADLDLLKVVTFAGQIPDPAKVLRQADLFVMSSRYEGFPNALLEAMACGLAVISTDCSSGPRDIIRDGIDGILVPPENIDALAAAMDRLMSNPAERQRLGSRAVEVLERFSTEKIMSIWDDVVSSACRREAHE